LIFRRKRRKLGRETSRISLICLRVRPFFRSVTIFPLGFGEGRKALELFRAEGIFGFREGKKLAGGLVVLSDVGFRLGAKLRAKGFSVAFLAKQKAPPYFEGTSVYSGGHSSHCGFRRGFPLRMESKEWGHPKKLSHQKLYHKLFENASALAQRLHLLHFSKGLLYGSLITSRKDVARFNA
jgi:hypothetical protein